MKVYEGEDKPDKYGKHPLRFRGYKNINEIHEWLFSHYNGYQFVILFNEMTDEYYPMGSEALVYFADEVLDEIAYYSGKKIVKND